MDEQDTLCGHCLPTIKALYCNSLDLDIMTRWLEHVDQVGEKN